LQRIVNDWGGACPVELALQLAREEMHCGLSIGLLCVQEKREPVLPSDATESSESLETSVEEGRISGIETCSQSQIGV